MDLVMADTMAKPAKKSSRSSLKGRDRLMLVAMQLFAERGFDGVTVRDIAKAADVSVGLINHHFESKEGLRAAVDAHFLAETSKAIVRASRRLAVDDLESVADYHRTWIREYEAEWPSFAAYLRRAITENSEWGENLFREYYDSVSRMITRSDADGKIAEDADRLWLPLLYAFMLVGPLLLDPYIRNMLGKSTYDPEMWGRFQKALRQLFWFGAAPRDS
jgi:AcrR family transcriptional regulator